MLSVLRAPLPGFAPFATWNGTAAAASRSPDSRCSLLGESGDVLVLQQSTGADASPRLRVERVLRASDASPPKSFCQCWTSDGGVFAAARDRHVTLHDARRGFAVLLRAQLRFSVASMDLVRCVTLNGADAYLLAVGTAFGAHLHRIELPDGSSNQDDDDDAVPVDSLPVLAAAYEDAPICFVRFSHDGASIALGTADGRLFVRQLRGSDAATLGGPNSVHLAAFGAEVFARVLASPRVTSISFAPCDTKLAAATRKGNVYVLSRSACDDADATGLDKWRLHPACRELTSNPKPPVAPGSSSAGAAGSAAAVAMQTLVCWWGSARASVLVVASRTVNYRVELVDATSGKLVHAVQAESRQGEASTASATGDDLLIGMCCVNATGDGVSRQRLLCHDTSSSVSVLAWQGLDVWGDQD